MRECQYRCCCRVVLLRCSPFRCCWTDERETRKTSGGRLPAGCHCQFPVRSFILKFDESFAGSVAVEIFAVTGLNEPPVVTLVTTRVILLCDVLHYFEDNGPCWRESESKHDDTWLIY